MIILKIILDGKNNPYPYTNMYIAEMHICTVCGAVVAHCGAVVAHCGALVAHWVAVVAHWLRHQIVKLQSWV
jgi:hypothetical protein